MSATGPTWLQEMCGVLDELKVADDHHTGQHLMDEN